VSSDFARQPKTAVCQPPRIHRLTLRNNVMGARHPCACGSRRSRLTECVTLTISLTIEKSGVHGRFNCSISVQDDTIVYGGQHDKE
jgi:hypothetical protein